MTPAPSRVRLAPLVCAGLAVLGCGGSQSSPSPPTTPKMTIVVHSDEETNAGRPLHVLVRAVTLQAFLEEPYAAVADKVITPDDSVLADGVVFPGHDLSLSIEKPEKTPVAVYFLFTNPGTPWKMQVEEPLPWFVTIELDEDRIVEED